MGCDYYIIKTLHIYYNDTEYLNLEIDRKNGYYFYSSLFDEDEYFYEDKVNDYIKRALTPEMEPITIYDNGEFNKPLTEAKYKSIIEERMNSAGKTWLEITKIKKVEVRFERN
jgi:hypothetical protein